jgi:predicted CxxxxCH...CXXCH cytochrome family protein
MKTTGGMYLLLGLIITTGIFLMSGCSEMKNDFVIPPAETIKVHSQGFENPTAGNFHGNILRNNDWNWSGCQECHGSAPEFTGGFSGVSCGTAGCHVDDRGVAKSIESCNTCHGDFHARANDFVSAAPPRDLSRNRTTSARGVGAHQIHLRGGSNSVAIECSECHRVPTGVFVADHLTPKGGAKVVFGNFSSYETEGADMNANPPTYNADVAGGPSCSNTYCHGHFTGGNNFTPVWTLVGSGEAACGTCHGDVETGNPLPDGHFSFPGIENCQSCHYVTMGNPIAERSSDGTYIIVNRPQHVDGAIHVFGTRRTAF